MGLNTDFAESRRKLVEALISEKILRDRNVINSLLHVPREEFIHKDLKHHAYSDTPLPIGYGNTISAPHMVAMMNEALELGKGMRVLEVGTGSGYHAATIAHIIRDPIDSRKGHVISIEIVPELIRFCLQNLKATRYSDNVTVIFSDGSKGFSDAAPYDRIVVTAASPDMPKPLLNQLKKGGIMVIPVGAQSAFQSLMVVKKEITGRISIQDRGGCSFVPLIGEFGFTN